MDQTKTGLFIIKLRKQQGLTQKDLAEKLHVSVTAVCKWEKGVNAPDISNLETLADLFQISVSELLNGEKLPTDISITVDKSLSEDVIASPKKIQIKNILLFLIAFLTTIVAICISIIYYNQRPLRYKVIDSYYIEPQKEHQETYGVEKAFNLVVEYDGDINEQLTFEYELNMANEILRGQNIDADILYIEYYDNYADDKKYDIISFIFLPLPEINTDSY